MVAVVLLDGDELALGGGAQSDALLGTWSMADVREHHLAGERELDGPVELACSHRSQCRVRPREELAAKAGANEAGDDLDVLLGDAQDLGHDIAVVDNALRGLVERECFAIPDSDRGVHLHGIVRLGRGDVGGVNLDRCGGEGGVGVSALA